MKKNVNAFAGSPEALASQDSTGTNREAVAVVGFALKFPQVRRETVETTHGETIDNDRCA
jgi:hypothetical protein